MSEIPFDTLHDPRLWEQVVRRVASRLSSEVLKELSGRVHEGLTDELRSVIVEIGKDLSAQMKPLNDEIVRAEGIISDLRSQQEKLSGTLGAFETSLATAVASAFTKIDLEIETRTERLATLAVGEGVVVANVLVQEMLQDIANGIKTVRTEMDDLSARLDRVDNGLARLHGNRTLRWFLRVAPRARRLLRAVTNDINDIHSALPHTMDDLLHVGQTVASVQMSVETLRGRAPPKREAP